MKNLILILLILCTPFVARANLSVSTFQIVFDAGSSLRSQVVRLTNTGHTAKRYRIKLINFAQQEDGKYQEITVPLAHNPFADSYIGYSPHEAYLQPGQSQAIRVVRRAMAAAPDGEYVSHLLMQEMPDYHKKKHMLSAKEVQISLQALYGVSIPVIIDKGTLHCSAKIGTIVLENKATQPYLKVEISKNGNKALIANIMIQKGKDIIGRLNNVKIFNNLTKRTVVIPLTEKSLTAGELILEDAQTHEVMARKYL